MGSIRERVSICVSLVIAAVDDFTGRPVSRGRLRVWIDGERPPMAKEDGYYIFTNLRGASPVIHLEGPVFHRQDIVFDERKRIQYEGKVLKVRMIPNHAYPIPRGTTCIQGHAIPDSTVLAYNKTLNKPLRLLYPYTAGQEEIGIFHPDEMDLEGKKFYIRNKEGTQQEILQIAGHPAESSAIAEATATAGASATAQSEEKNKKNLYQLYLPLAYSYRKIGTEIFPVYMSKADQSGDFYLPAAGVYTDTAVFAFWLEGSELEQKEMELISGKVNLLSGVLGFSGQE